MSALERRINIAAVVLPLLGFVAAIALLWGGAVDGLDLGIMAGMYLFSGLGIFIGYHRLLTHRAFETPAPVRGLFAIAGSMALQGPPIRWVADHRMHHDLTDVEGDPHSPHTHAGPGVKGKLKGMFWGHVGWLFDKEGPRAKVRRYAPDLLKDKTVVWVDKHFFTWLALGFAIPFALGFGISGGSLGAGLTALVWGGFVRMFMLHHATWSVNSICHMYGERPFETDDEATNNWVLALVTMGEGWHHNHHVFPTSAKTSLVGHQIDPSYGLIKVMEKLHLASNVRVPTEAEIERKLVKEIDPVSAYEQAEARAKDSLRAKLTAQAVDASAEATGTERARRSVKVAEQVSS